MSKIGNKFLAQVANNTVKANKSGGTANPSDVALSDVAETGSSILTILNGSKAVVSPSNLTIQANLTSAKFYVGNGSNVPVGVSVSGDLTMDNTGAFTVAKIAGTTVSGTTGSGNVVFATAPTMSNPIVGTQTAGDNSTKAASTAYVAAAITNALAAFQPLEATYAASTANIAGTYSNGVSGVGATFTVTATGAFSIDGVSPPSGSRILLKDQSSGFQNGVYDLTTVGTTGVSPILTRSADYNTPAAMNAGDLVPVVNGTANSLTSWLQTATIATIGTDSLTFSEYSKNPSSYLSSALTSAHLFVGNGSNVAADVAVSGDLTLANTGAFTIASSAVTNAKLANMAAHTFKGNNTGSPAAPSDLTATQLTAELSAMVGDSGSGGTKGLVPAPGSGDAAAGKFLKADGTFAVPPGSTTVRVGRYTNGTGVDSNTTLLMNFDQDPPIDFSNNSYAVTKPNGSPVISATQAKFGASSFFAGSGASTSNYGVNGPGALGSGDFTVEWWAWSSGWVTPAIFVHTTDSGGNFWLMRYANSNNFEWQNSAGLNLTSASMTPTANVWHHFAVVRHSGTTTVYLDGTSVVSGADSENYTQTQVHIGYSTNQTFSFNGYIDEVRISNVARYTTTFTPTSTAFPTVGTIETNPGSWISSLSNTAVGVTQVNFAGGTFANEPVLHVTPINASASQATAQIVGTPSTSSCTVATFVGGVLANCDVDITAVSS